MMKLFVAIAIIGVAGVAWFVTQNQKDNNFFISAEQIVADLEGRTVPLAYGQIWSFEPKQEIKVSIVSKKQVDDYMVVAANVKAVANVELSKDEKEKKLPARVALNGLMKLTYEQIGHAWYLVGAESVTLKILPVNRP